MRAALLLALVALTALLLGGCIRFDGDGSIDATVLVTRDWGETTLKEADVTLRQGASALDALRAVASVETRHGAGFVHAVDGLEGGQRDPQRDWFYEVDGAVGDRGAAQWVLRDGATVHWDHRAWREPLEVPGLFNSFSWPDAQQLPADGADPLWPPGPAWRVGGPEQADWDELDPLRLEGDALHVPTAGGGTAVEPPWAVTLRVGPVGSVRAVAVEHGLEAPRPTAGLGQVATPEATLEVRPW